MFPGYDRNLDAAIDARAVPRLSRGRAALLALAVAAGLIWLGLSS